MTDRLITESACGLCGTDLRDGIGSRRIAIVDQDMDCVVAYRCPVCKAEEDELPEAVAATSDPASERAARWKAHFRPSKPI